MTMADVGEGGFVRGKSFSSTQRSGRDHPISERPMGYQSPKITEAGVGMSLLSAWEMWGSTSLKWEDEESCHIEYK